MAEVLEEAHQDLDRVLDNNGFLNAQFDIFTHDYRKLTEVPKCSAHEGGSGCCEESKVEEAPYKKKDVVNTTRKLLKAVASLKAMSSSDVIKPMIDQLEEINQGILGMIKEEGSEFSTTSVKLPDFDPLDMELLLGKDEAPPSVSMLEAVSSQRASLHSRMLALLLEADILLTEYDHIKHGLAK